MDYFEKKATVIFTVVERSVGVGFPTNGANGMVLTQSIRPSKEFVISSLSNTVERLKFNTCKTRENSNFMKNGKIVISVKIENFSRSWMMKRTTPLESSREI